MIKFKVYPESKSLYCEVHIFDTREEMYDYNKGVEPDYEAQFVAVDHYVITPTTDKKTPLMGLLYFHKEQCGAGVISHEMTHAALAWFRRKKFRFEDLYCENGGNDKSINVPDSEEEFAWVLGNLVQQFYRKYYDTIENY